MGRELSVSVVLYRPDVDAFRETVSSLRIALHRSRASGVIGAATFWLVDNGSDDPEAIERVLESELSTLAEWVGVNVLRGHGNVGYAHGHDLAIGRDTGPYHLVLNPDVVLAPDALTAAIRFLETHPTVGMVTPHVSAPTGDRLFLCKRYPSVLVLALRGFGPTWLQKRFARLLNHYEMRDLPEHEPATGIPIASGCFMLARAEALRAVGGFSRRYFLYFEDFDLSVRFRRIADIAYVPDVRIVHGGGNAARKGWRHARFFIRSALTFFNTHGWRLW